MGSLTVKTAQALVKTRQPGRYSDGEGLYLRIPQEGESYCSPSGF